MSISLQDTVYVESDDKAFSKAFREWMEANNVMPLASDRYDNFGPGGKGFFFNRHTFHPSYKRKIHHFIEDYQVRKMAYEMSEGMKVFPG